MVVNRIVRPPSVTDAIRRLGGASAADGPAPAEPLVAATSTEVFSGIEPPPDDVSPPEETALASPADHASGETDGAGPLPSVPAGGLSRVPAQSVESALAAMGWVPPVALPPAPTVPPASVRPAESAPMEDVEAPDPVAVIGQGHDHAPRRPQPRIVELTQRVERVVIGAAAAERLQREQTARESATEVTSLATVEGRRTLDRAAAESRSRLAEAKARAVTLVSDGRAERDATLARADSRARALAARAEVELDRRVRRIATLTEEITDITNAAVERTAAGAMNEAQVARFISALGAATERALGYVDEAELAVSATRRSGSPTG